MNSPTTLSTAAHAHAQRAPVLQWRSVCARIAAHVRAVQADPCRTVVLLPYAQLLSQARAQWVQCVPDAGVLPRFETTSNWAARLAPFVPQPEDVCFQPGADGWTAQRLLLDAGLKEHAPWLAGHVRDAVLQVASLAAAQPPAQRAQWATQHLAQWQAVMASPHVRLEAAVASVALLWAGHSAYATDVLHACIEQGAMQALVVVPGFQADPLTLALLHAQEVQHPHSTLVVPLLANTPYATPVISDTSHAEDTPNKTPLSLSSAAQPAHAGSPVFPWTDSGHIAVHVCDDMADLALRTACCVQAAVSRQQGLVALVDVDRALTRRIRALLAGQGLAIRDETGWKLSTTIAASHVMAWLRACQMQASSDTVLQWLKLAQCYAAACADDGAPSATSGCTDSVVTTAEQILRRRGTVQWPQKNSYWADALSQQPAALAALRRIAVWRQALQAPRPPQQWLHDMRHAARAIGLADWLLQDTAGRTLWQALGLEQGDELDTPRATSLHHAHFQQPWSLAMWTAWVNDVLEASSFRPDYPLREQVVITPMSQLLGRDFAAVVISGCDAQRIPASPEPVGHWTAAQRQSLGLPSRLDAQHSMRSAWGYALGLWQPDGADTTTLAPTVPRHHVDILYSRTDRDGAALHASPLLLEWALLAGRSMTADADTSAPAAPHRRSLLPQPVAVPAPTAAHLPLRHLSASSYQRLRQCPYQFFAQHLLRLQEVPELTTTVEKRDMGIWLHLTLKRFHEDWQHAGAADFATASAATLTAALDAAADWAQQQQHLHAADFLPFAATWPVMRDGYVQWLQHQPSAFVRAEAPCTVALRDAMQAYLPAQELSALLPDTTQADTPPPEAQPEAAPSPSDPTRPAAWADICLQGTIDRIDTLTTSPALAASGQAQPLLLDYKTESAAQTRERVGKHRHEDVQLPFYAALQSPLPVQTAYINVGERGDTALHAHDDVDTLCAQLLRGMAHDLRAISHGSPLRPLGEGVACQYCAVRGLCRKDFWEPCA